MKNCLMEEFQKEVEISGIRKQDAREIYQLTVITKKLRLYNI